MASLAGSVGETNCSQGRVRDRRSENSTETLATRVSVSLNSPCSVNCNDNIDNFTFKKI